MNLLIKDLTKIFKKTDKFTIVKLFIKYVISFSNLKHIKIGALNINSPGRYFDDWDLYRLIENIKGLGIIKDIKNDNILEIGPGKNIGLATLSSIFKIKNIDFIEPDKSCWLSKKKLNDLIYEKYGIKPRIKCHYFNKISEVDNKKYSFIYSWSCYQHINFNELNNNVKVLKKILTSNGKILIHIRWTDHFSKNKDEFNQYMFGRNFDNNKYFLKCGFYTNRVPKLEFEKLIKKNNLKIIKEKNIYIEFNSFKLAEVSEFEFDKKEILPFIRSTSYLITHI